MSQLCAQVQYYNKRSFQPLLQVLILFKQYFIYNFFLSGIKLDKVFYIKYQMLNERNADKNMISQSYKKKLCPHVKNPSTNCYCSKLTSSDIEKAIFYCSNNFESCEIFKTSFSRPQERVIHQ